MRLFLSVILLFAFSTPAFAQVDCAKNERRIEVLECVEEEYDRVEGNLRKAYLQAIYRLNEDGNEIRMEMLRDAQRAWEDYRYKACDAQIVEVTGLSEEFKIKTRLCHNELAERRTNDILKHFKTWDYIPDPKKERNSAITKKKKSDSDEENPEDAVEE